MHEVLKYFTLTEIQVERQHFRSEARDQACGDPLSSVESVPQCSATEAPELELEPFYYSREGQRIDFHF